MSIPMIWGLGNELRGDDAVGVWISERLRQDPSLKGLVHTCFTVPGNYVAVLRRERPERLILVDSADMGLPPGSVRRLPLGRTADVSFSNHDMPLELMLASFSVSVTVIGIQPQRTDLGAPLTEAVLNSAQEVLEALRNDDLDRFPFLEVTT